MSRTITEPPNSVGAHAVWQSSARTKTLVLLAFAAVYLVWGSTYLAIRVGIESFPPFILAGIRHVIAGLVLYAVFRRKTGIRPTGAHWWTAAVTGFMLLFVGNGGVSWAEQTVPSGIAALLVATVSLWLVIFDWLGVGLGFALFEAPRQARCSHVERGDAEPRGWRGALDCRRANGRIPRIPFCRCLNKVMARACVPHRFWVGHRVQRLCLYSGEEHPGPRGNVRVCEPRSGIVSRLAHRCRAPIVAHDSGCWCDPHGGDSRNYRAAPDPRQGTAAGSRRSLIAQRYRPFDFSTLEDLSG